MSSRPDSLLASLREATREAHAAIEQVPALARLLDPGLGRADYAATLGRLYRFHAALEPRLVAALVGWPAAAALAAAGRPGALAADLAALGRPAPAPAPEAALPGLAEGMAALGCLYVMEGSSLGGRVIARRLVESLGVTPGQGGRFFGGEGADTARARWRVLCDLLEEVGAAASPEGRARLLHGATEGFTRLGDWMAGTPAVVGPAMAGWPPAAAFALAMAPPPPR